MNWKSRTGSKRKLSSIPPGIRALHNEITKDPKTARRYGRLVVVDVREDEQAQHLDLKDIETVFLVYGGSHE